MRFLIKLGVIFLVLTIGSVAYSGRVMKADCETRYVELKREKSNAQTNYMKSKKSLRSNLGKADSQSEVDMWEKQDWELTDDYNRKMADIEQEMQYIYNDPSCWEWKE
jgi:hypothetical protein